MSYFTKCQEWEQVSSWIFICKQDHKQYIVKYDDIEIIPNKELILYISLAELWVATETESNDY